MVNYRSTKSGVVTDLSEELFEMVGLLTHLHHSTEPLTLVPAKIQLTYRQYA